MTDRHARQIYRAITEGRNLTAADADHLAGCETCRDVANRAATFNDELARSIRDQRIEPMPADPLAGATPPRRGRWSAPILAVVLVLLAVGGAVAGSRLLVRPSLLATPSPAVASPSEPGPTTPTVVAEVKPGNLARVLGHATVVMTPGGQAFGEIEPDQTVLVVDQTTADKGGWWRIEFEYCCRDDAPSDEWVFGWVAADLSVASADLTANGLERPGPTNGPTLEGEDWECPPTPEGLNLVAEPVRWYCQQGDTVSIRGQLSGLSGDRSRTLYPGDPADLTGPPTAGLMPAGMQFGKILPLHVASDPVLLAWFNDQRVKDGDQVTVTGHFGPGAVACQKSPRLVGFPPMSAEDADLWCQQQFSVTGIEATGGDPLIPAPSATPGWTAPPGIQAASGDGWRLLASADRNQVAITVAPDSVAAATTPEEFTRLWLSVAHGAPPSVDFNRQFVVRFVPAVSGSCPWIAFGGIGVNVDANRLFGRFEALAPQLFIGNVPSNFGCTSDSKPHAFLVAVDRVLAPAPEFTLRLHDASACDGCGITTDATTVDLGGH